MNYHSTFAFKDGDFNKPSQAAGATLESVMRLMFDWSPEGAEQWRFASGMADTIYAPLYRLADRRGVNFHFFSKVTSLHVSDDGQTISSVDINVQAKVKNGGKYEPLLDCPKFKCWPSTPLYDQLENGDALREVNLEGLYDQWPGVDNITLQLGRDFDAVILAIPVASHPFIAVELMKRSQRYEAMVTNSDTVSTISLQLWMTESAQALGWASPGEMNYQPYTPPLDCMSEMTQVTDTERWPQDCKPGSVIYFSGVIPTGPNPPPSDVNYPIEQTKYTGRVIQEWLDHEFGRLLPVAANQTNPNGLNYSYVTDCQGGYGLESQYYRANVDPHERYTLTLPGTTMYRLMPDDSSYSNLFLAGDWTGLPTGIELGCAESSTESGDVAAMGALRYLNYYHICPLTGGVVVAPPQFQPPPATNGQYRSAKLSSHNPTLHHHYPSFASLPQPQNQMAEARVSHSITRKHLSTNSTTSQALEHDGLTLPTSMIASLAAAGPSMASFPATKLGALRMTESQYASLRAQMQLEFKEADAAFKKPITGGPQAIMNAFEQTSDSLIHRVDQLVHEAANGVQFKDATPIKQTASGDKKEKTDPYQCPIYNASAPAQTPEDIFKVHDVDYSREWWYYGGKVEDTNGFERSALATMWRRSIDLPIVIANVTVATIYNVSQQYMGLVQVTDSECGQLFGVCYVWGLPGEQYMTVSFVPRWRMTITCHYPAFRTWTWEHFNGTLGSVGAFYRVNATVLDRLERDLNLEFIVEDTTGTIAQGYGASSFSPKWFDETQKQQVDAVGGDVTKFFEFTKDPMACHGSYYVSSLAMVVREWMVRSASRPLWYGNNGIMRFDKELYGLDPVELKEQLGKVQHVWVTNWMDDYAVLTVWHVMTHDESHQLNDITYARYFNRLAGQNEYEWPLDAVTFKSMSEGSPTPGWRSPLSKQLIPWAWTVDLAHPTNPQWKIQFDVYPDMLNMEIWILEATIGSIWEGGAVTVGVHVCAYLHLHLLPYLCSSDLI
jgi:hypothetical protein